jgi:large subunit ribosomal protein L4
MATAKRFDENGEASASVELPEDLFGQPMHEQAVYETVNAYLTHQRQGTAKTKERGEVAYSTSKLYRQKGTGNARAGSAKSPIRRGGGTIFGPKPRPWRTNLNKKTRRLALRAALSDRASLSAVHVVEDPNLDAPKTKAMSQLLANMGLAGKTVLFVTTGERGILYKSLRNMERVDTIPANQLNAYVILRNDVLVFTEESLRRTVEVFGS